MTTDRKAGHTPGPWAVNPTLAQVDAFDEDQPLPVCQLLWPTDQRDEPETFANARLIAAAPDLLAACDEAVKLAKLAVTLTGNLGDDAYVAGVEMKLNAAIAKARGES